MTQHAENPPRPVRPATAGPPATGPRPATPDRGRGAAPGALSRALSGVAIPGQRTTPTPENPPAPRS
ncbi:hypothetical protein ACFWZ7_25445 [Nocardiopsis alba]|uniref:hypothetical protein n=1 Tax=Nocardiopsis alba TaxID=53437 RepID=UPI00366DFD56